MHCCTHRHISTDRKEKMGEKKQFHSIFFCLAGMKPTHRKLKNHFRQVPKHAHMCLSALYCCYIIQMQLVISVQWEFYVIGWIAQYIIAWYLNQRQREIDVFSCDGQTKIQAVCKLYINATMLCIVNAVRCSERH